MIDDFIDSEIGLQLWADHAWVEGMFYLKTRTKYQQQWRLNSNLLLLEPLHSEIEKEITLYFELNRDCGVNVTLIWDAMKAVL